MGITINKTTFNVNRSGDTAKALRDSNMLVVEGIINGERKVNFKLPSCTKKYWKLNGARSKVIEMNADEKQVVDNTEAQAIEDTKDITISLDKLTKALALIILTEINILRVKAGLTERTVTQLKNAVKTKYNSLS